MQSIVEQMLWGQWKPLNLYFIEIFVNTSLDECIKRDPKGLYKKALNGEIKGFTGVDAPYEEPKNAEIEIKNMTIEDSVEYIINKLKF